MSKDVDALLGRIRGELKAGMTKESVLDNMAASFTALQVLVRTGPFSSGAEQAALQGLFKGVLFYWLLTDGDIGKLLGGVEE